MPGGHPGMDEYARLDALLADCGGAAYVCELDRLGANVSRFLGAFQRAYAPTRLAYSYKTNYLPALCREADRLGLLAEVVSGMEYEWALLCGVPAQRIVFNGPAKTAPEIARALSEGALVNVDSLGEARLVAGQAARIDAPARVGLRCNLDLNWNGRSSRFGIAEAGGELAQAWRLLRAVPNIRIEGLHCHTSFDRSAASYRRRTERLVALAGSLFQHESPRFIDIGGGFFGPMPPELATQFDAPPPSPEDYAAAVGEVMASAFVSSGGPELWLEPGVGLVGDVLSYACRVEQVKTMAGRRVAVSSGASHDIRIVPNRYNPPLRVLRGPRADGAALAAPLDLVGHTCLEHDVIVRDGAQDLAVGDIVVLSNVGAYSMVVSPNFIRTSPPVVAWRDGGWQLLRRRLSAQELMAQFPA